MMVSVACLAAACGEPATLTPDQALAAGKKAFQSLSSFHLSGTLTADSTSTLVKATVLSNGDASGTITLGADTSNFRIVSHAYYFDTLNPFVESSLNGDLAALATHLKGAHWWQAPPSHPIGSVLDFLSPTSFSVFFLSGRSHLSETTETGSHGRWKLQDSSGTIYLASAAPHEVVEVKSAENYLVNGATNLDLSLSAFDQPATVALPAAFLSNLPQSFPPFFVVDSVEVKGECNASGCVLTGMVRPAAGNGGSATVNFALLDKDHKQIGSCTTTASLKDFDDVKPVSCRAVGSGWTHFYYGGGGTYYVQGLANNPDYNP